MQTKLSGSSTIKANLDYTVDVTGFMLRGARQQSELARKIEDLETTISEEEKNLHMSHAIAALFMSVAGLEAHIWKVLHDGPEYHKGGSGEIITKRLNQAKSLRDVILTGSGLYNKREVSGVCEAYCKILEILDKPRIDKGSEAYQNLCLIVKARNELVHYKSILGSEQNNLDFVQRLLKEKKIKPPPFYTEASPFFPHRVLSYGFSKWVVDSCVSFLDCFHTNLGTDYSAYKC